MSSKLYVKAEGPYSIIECGPNYTYKIKRCSDNKVNPSLINATNLKRYHDPNTHRAGFEPQSDSETENETESDESGDETTGTPQSHSDSQNSQGNSQRIWKINKLPVGRFKNGRREIRVEWENGEKTWEPDYVFPPDVLEYVNKRFTKMGKLRKTCFKRKQFSQTNS